MKRENALSKMLSEHYHPVHYYLNLMDDFLLMNEVLGHEIIMEHTGYECKACGSDEKIFAHGLCKKCYFEHPMAGEWVLHPEKSTAHLEIEDRDLAYEKEIQLQPHMVYLAKTSGVKVGVTRKSQVPYRWIDQGADEALPFLEVPNRYLAGLAEVALKQYISDKTAWREMLTSNKVDVDLEKELEKLIPHLPEEVQPYLLQERKLYKFHYPVLSYPNKIKSIKLDQHKRIEGKPVGIKGQYLIFENGNVFNIRNHEGYIVKIEIL